MANRTRRLMRMTMAADHSGRPESTYEAESRFRDRRGRWHYDNGRYAPRSETDIGIDGRFREDRDWPRGEDREGQMMEDWPVYDYVPPVYREDPVRQIGFVAHGGEIGGNYRSDAEYRAGREMDPHHGHAETGHAYSDQMPRLTKEKAEQWVRSMHNANGTNGQNWNMEQAQHIMHRYGIQCDPVEFYVALNMMKSDYSKAAAQLGVDKEEFYAAMAKAFLMDDDAHKDKLARYWQYIAKK